MEEKILTLHPDKNKQGVRISKVKYDLIRETILETLRSHKQLTYNELAEKVGKKLSGKFDGSIAWYVTTVKLDLEARKVIKRVPKTSPQQLQLTTD